VIPAAQSSQQLGDPSSALSQQRVVGQFAFEQRICLSFLFVIPEGNLRLLLPLLVFLCDLCVFPLRPLR
jgi:hypothetical protein